MTITEFLEARIKEDEAVARAALDEPFLGRVDDGKWEANTSNTSPNVEGRAFFSIAASDDEPQAFLTRDQAEHIARHDPVGVMAECAAKRAIVEMHRAESWSIPPRPSTEDTRYIIRSDRPDIYVRVGDDIVESISTEEYFKRVSATKNPPGRELLALASVYKDHPDYRQEWA